MKEGEENVLVLRLQVMDKDTEGTEAWRVKYIIHGDTNNNFIITTDPVTNEGLLFLDKVQPHALRLSLQHHFWYQILKRTMTKQSKPMRHKEVIFLHVANYSGDFSAALQKFPSERET